jgi:DMSO/TMAO reductase YedYZ heme-binding membrane subunit
MGTSRHLKVKDSKKESGDKKKQVVKPWGWSRISLTSFTIFLVIFSYAVIRYNVIQGIIWDHLPLYVSNKAIALGSVVFISISYLLGSFHHFFPRLLSNKLSLRKHFGLLGFTLACVHSLISLIILRPDYYRRFFLGETLNLTGELTLLFGVLALIIFSIVAITSLPSVFENMEYHRWKSIQRKGYLAFFLVMLHVFTLGMSGWLKSEDWPGGLLPISLIAFIIIFNVLLINILGIFTSNKRNNS